MYNIINLRFFFTGDSAVQSPHDAQIKGTLYPDVYKKINKYRIFGGDPVEMTFRFFPVAPRSATSPETLRTADEKHVRYIIRAFFDINII